MSLVDVINTGSYADIELSDYDGHYTDAVYPILTLRKELVAIWTSNAGLIYTDRFDVQIGTGADEGAIKIITGAGRAYFPLFLPGGAVRFFLGAQPSYFVVTVDSADLTVSDIDSNNNLILSGIPSEWYA